MNLEFSQQDVAFLSEVRQFIDEFYPKRIQQKVKLGLTLEKNDWLEWQKILYAKGWAAPNWPVEYGGTGWTATQKYIWAAECAKAYVLYSQPFGLTMVAPIIYTYGTQQQKSRFLPDILASNVWWCQGYSEPNAGSDLASLKTTAVKDGDHYIVNGTKTWTTYAHFADWIFCLVRTGDKETKNQNAISFLLIDMKTPGITVTPIITLEGHHEVNQVHFDQVRVPADNLIGEEGKGWVYAKLLLTEERTGIAMVANSKVALADLKQSAKQRFGSAPALLDDPIFSHKVAEVEIDLLALETTELRTLSTLSNGQAPGPESSILKLKGTEIAQQVYELYLELAAYYCLPQVSHQDEPGENIGDGALGLSSGDYLGTGYNAIDNSVEYAFDNATCKAASHYFAMRKTSIFGGTNEIQKNIIAKMVLQL